jgi:hypothetical protein
MMILKSVEGKTRKAPILEDVVQNHQRERRERNSFDAFEQRPQKADP